MNKIIVTLLLLLGWVCQGAAQKQAAWINAADTALYAEHDYYKAFKYYEAALLYDTTDIDLWYRKAEAARLFNAYYDAEQAYLKVINSDRLLEYPCALAYAGQMRLSLGAYDEAKRYFERFQNLQANGKPSCMETVERGLRNIAFVRAQEQRPQPEIDPLNMGTPINTEFSDFGVYPVADGFYYTRYEYADYENKEAPGRRYARIYKVVGGVPERFPSYFSRDTALHIAHTAFDREHSRFYYTLCEYEDGINIHCDLYYREVNDQGVWGAPQPVTELNGEAFTTTQPSIGWDEEIGGETLYFVSDRPGGEGGLDIWKSEIIDGRHQAPVNLGRPINTPYDEATPFFHPFSQRLFFSSDGHPGYGGYDVFSVRKDQERWTGLENMGPGVNTGVDEVYYALDELGMKGYFSSNRLGSTLFEPVEDESERLKEACCLDIYQYEAPACELLVRTFRDCDGSGANGEILNGVTVEVFDITDGEPGRSLFSSGYQSDNEVEFNPLEPRRKYKVLARKEGFDDAYAILDFTQDAFPCQNGDREILEICLKRTCPLPALSARVLNPSGESVEAVELRLIELGQSRRFPNAISEYNPSGVCTGDLLAVYGRFPGERFIEPGEAVQVEYDTYYGLIATKERYSFDTVTVRIAQGDVQGTDCALTVDLQIEPVAELNELTLYFDNDSPHPDTRRITSDSNYIDVYKKFYQKKAQFRARFSTDPADFLESQELEAFFERELRGNAERLTTFSDSLLTLLCRGAAITLEMNGCASPRFNDANNVRQRTYNEALTKRRVDSVMDFFREYHKTPDGPPAFEEFLGGQLRIVMVERACQVADREELSDLDDLKNSIFSIDASVARRVEVRVRFRTEQ